MADTEKDKQQSYQDNLPGTRETDKFEQYLETPVMPEDPSKLGNSNDVQQNQTEEGQKENKTPLTPDEYITKRLAGEEVDSERVPEMFREPPAEPEATPEQLEKFDVAFQQYQDSVDAEARATADPDAIKRLMTDEELERQETWEKRDLEREAEKAENDVLQSGIRDMYNMDLEGNTTTLKEGSELKLAETLDGWVVELEKKKEEYAAAPADDSNNIVGYVRAEEMLKEAQAMAKEAREFAIFQEKMQDAARQMAETDKMMGRESAYANFDASKPMTAEEYNTFKKNYADTTTELQGLQANGFELPESLRGKDLGTFQPESLPDKIPTQPDRNKILDFQHEALNEKLPPIDKQAAAQNTEQGGPTVGGMMKSGNKFTDALQTLQKRGEDTPLSYEDKKEMRTQLEDGYRELGEKAFDIAWKKTHPGPDENTPGPQPDPEYKRQFIEGFVEKEQISINAIMSDGLPKAAAERRLADLALLSENPEAVSDRLQQRYKHDGSPMLDDTKYGSIDKFRNDPKSMAGTLSHEILMDVDVTRSRVEHLATMNGEGYHQADNAGGKAVSELIKKGADPKNENRDAIIAKNQDKFPPKPQTSGNPDWDRLSKAAEVIVLAEQIQDREAPLTMSAVKDRNHPDHHIVSDMGHFSFDVRKMEQLEAMAMDEGPDGRKTRGMTPREKADYFEQQAEQKMDRASAQVLEKSEASLARTFGPDGAAEMQSKVKGDRPANLDEAGQTIAESTRRVDKAKENYALASAINSDPALKEIAALAMQSAPDGANKAEFAMNMVKEAQGKTPEERKKQAQEMMIAVNDTDKDGQLSEKEALVMAAKKMFKTKDLDKDGDGIVSGEEAKTALIAKFDGSDIRSKKDGKLDYNEQQELTKALGGDKGMLAEVMKVSGVDIAAIGKSMKDGGLGGGDDMKVAKSGGTVMEGQTVPTGGGKQQGQGAGASVAT